MFIWKPWLEFMTSLSGRTQSRLSAHMSFCSIVSIKRSLFLSFWAWSSFSWPWITWKVRSKVPLIWIKCFYFKKHQSGPDLLASTQITSIEVWGFWHSIDLWCRPTCTKSCVYFGGLFSETQGPVYVETTSGYAAICAICGLLLLHVACVVLERIHSFCW